VEAITEAFLTPLPGDEELLHLSCLSPLLSPGQDKHQQAVYRKTVLQILGGELLPVFGPTVITSEEYYAKLIGLSPDTVESKLRTTLSRGERSYRFTYHAHRQVAVVELRRGPAPTPALLAEELPEFTALIPVALSETDIFFHTYFPELSPAPTADIAS
jgi:hypothetical protein